VDAMNINITVGGTSSIQNETSDGRNAYTVADRGGRKDRRKNQQDRRRCVREGIFVSLSRENERRVLRDRRRATA
jgi:hypothetical protein